MRGNQATEGGSNVTEYMPEVRTGTNPYNISYTYDAADNRLTRVKDGVTTNYRIQIWE